MPQISLTFIRQYKAWITIILYHCQSQNPGSPGWWDQFRPSLPGMQKISVPTGRPVAVTSGSNVNAISRTQERYNSAVVDIWNCIYRCILYIYIYIYIDSYIHIYIYKYNGVIYGAMLTLSDDMYFSPVIWHISIKAMVHLVWFTVLKTGVFQ